MRFLALICTALAGLVVQPALAQTFPAPTQLAPPAGYAAPPGNYAAPPVYGTTTVPAPPPASYGRTPAYPPTTAATVSPPAAYGEAVPPGANPATGARPGHEPGSGISYPVSPNASNIDRMDMRSTIAPTLPTPQLGANAGPAEYLLAARSSLAAGRTGEAQQALEMAQTRLLDRSVPYDATNTPSGNPAVNQITEALHALAAGDRGRTMQLIDATIPLASR